MAAYASNLRAPVAYASTPTSYARPVVTGAPSYVRPQVASYVAAPQAMPQVTAMTAPQMPAGPQAPASLTAGIPTPSQIAAQKAQFAEALDKQLKEAVETVKKETEIEKQMVKFNTDKQISLYNMQVDEKLAELTAAAAEASTVSDLELKKALVERTLQLNSQAQGLVFDYNMKSTQQELLERKAAFEQQYINEESKLAQQYAATLSAAGPAAMPAAISQMPTTTAAPVTRTYAAPATYAAAPRTTVGSTAVRAGAFV